MDLITRTWTCTPRGKGLTLVFGLHPFPVKNILIALNARGLCWLGITSDVARLRRDWPGAELVRDQDMTAPFAADIARLWSGRLEKLSFPVVLYGTDFQLKVWKELLKIQPGSTVTYEQVAKNIGKPKALRAVGSAVGKNPVSLIVPCHRVVNKGGNKVHYGWGADIKTALLEREFT